MSDIVITDLINATWEDARRETDPERKAQLERDAAMLEDVWQRSKYALAPTREQFQAAIGNTTLNLAGTLSDVAAGLKQLDTRVGEIHEHVQHNDTLVSTFIQTFGPQFAAFEQKAQAAWEASGRGLKKLETTVARLNTRHGRQIKHLSGRMDSSEADRRQMNERLNRIEGLLVELEADRGDYTPEQRADLVTTLLRMIAEYKAAHGDDAAV